MNDFDLTNLAVQMTMPNNKLIKDENTGIPGVYVYFPKAKLKDVLNTDDDSTHPAFIVNGKEIDGFWLGKYISSYNNGVLYSLPGQDPTHDIQHQNFISMSYNKGNGHHNVTMAEAAYVALWCKKNGFMPNGNNNFGKDAAENVYQAVPSPNVSDNGRIARTLTGTGPKSWNHNNDLSGVADLNGNVWEANSGIRFVFGELQVLVNNNAADPDNPMSEKATTWKAIDVSTGEYMDPQNTVTDTLANTYSHNVSVKLAWKTGHFEWTNVLSADTASDSSKYCSFESVVAASSVCDAAKLKLRALALLTDDGFTPGDYKGDGFWANNGAAERICWRGGSWGRGSDAGVFEVAFNAPRSDASWSNGGRLAYIENLPSE